MQRRRKRAEWSAQWVKFAGRQAGVVGVASCTTRVAASASAAAKVARPHQNHRNAGKEQRASESWRERKRERVNRKKRTTKKNTSNIKLATRRDARLSTEASFSTSTRKNLQLKTGFQAVCVCVRVRETVTKSERVSE